MPIAAVRSLQDLVRVQKPSVRRRGRVVKQCHFFKRTGECFGTRCFWTQNGDCPFWNKNKEEFLDRF
jgi:hypothetical protein